MFTKAEWADRWPDFSPREVLSPEGLILYYDRGILPVQPRALDVLQAFRNFLGEKIIVNSVPLGFKYRGWRSCAENGSIGGAKWSFHLQGLAFDVNVVREGNEIGDSGWVARKAVKSEMWRGVIEYENFTHLDVGCREHVYHSLW